MDDVSEAFVFSGVVPEDSGNAVDCPEDEVIPADVGPADMVPPEEVCAESGGVVAAQPTRINNKIIITTANIACFFNAGLVLFQNETAAGTWHCFFRLPGPPYARLCLLRLRLLPQLLLYKALYT